MDRFVKAEVNATLLALTNILADRYWISPRQAIAAADDKLSQLVRARQHGLVVPKTLLTTNPATICEFLDRSGGTLVAKRLSAPLATDPVIYTTEFTRETVNQREADFRACPTLVQERITKAADIRVVVVGDTTFAIQIHSQDNPTTGLDWRRIPASELRCTPHRLPIEVSAALVDLTASYGLCYSSPDLILTPDGSYIFLELNPNGQWGWIESLTGLPITAKLVDLLLHHSLVGTAKR